MSQTGRHVVLLDACVIYPAPIRDLLLHLASFKLFTPKWTDQIQDEWTRNLLLNRPDLTSQQLQRQVDAMNVAFPDANVEGYQQLVPLITLPDTDDRHVLAAAVHCQADVLVTANGKDFPDKIANSWAVTIIHPDQFVAKLIDQNPQNAIAAFRQQVANLKNPPYTSLQVLDTLRNLEMLESCDKLAALLD